MEGVIPIKRLAAFVSSLKKQNKKTVLIGGCFDILHPGHITFLEKAKKAGDILIVLLESDQKVTELKGVGRPVNTQTERAKVLSALKTVDCVVRLPYLKSDTQYDQLTAKIKPDVIAATSKDTDTSHHRRSAKLVGAKFKVVTKIDHHSTSSILKH